MKNCNCEKHIDLSIKNELPSLRDYEKISAMYIGSGEIGPLATLPMDRS